MSLDELIARAKALVDDGHTPACQLAVARDGQLLAFETFGAAGGDTRFCVFSATKPLVASMVWLLIGEGLIDVGERVSDHIPEFASHGKHAVTIEQVLLHTAGFPNAPLELAAGADPAQRVAAFTDWQLEWEPGTRFEYHAASAHWVLAELIQRATGPDFRDAIEDGVCRPLGLPRVLGIAPGAQADVIDGVPSGVASDPDVGIDLLRFNDPAVRAAGVPGGGAIMTAATMAAFYQALLHDTAHLWDADVLHDATTNIRCRFDDPLMRVPTNRTIGVVVAGDDSLHQFRYAMFGKGCSPGAFGHAGAFCQVAWADPATGISFAFVKNGLAADMFGDAVRVLPLCDLASAL